MSDDNFQRWCLICGAPIVYHAGEKEMDHWLSRARLIVSRAVAMPGQDLRDSEYVPHMTPTVRLNAESRIWDPVPQVYDKHSGCYIPLNYRLPMPFVPGKMTGAVTGYPFHEACWNILKQILCSYDGQVTLLRMATLFKIFNCYAYNAEEAMWPHDYGGLLKYHFDARYNSELPVPLELAYMEEDPWDIKADALEDMMRRMQTSKASNTLSRSVPSLFKIPSELAERIYEYLEISEVKTLQTIYSADMSELSNAFWKKCCLSSTTEVGYFCLNDAVPELLKNHSWFEIAAAAENIDILSAGMKNRLRIWNLCKGLASQVIDISDSERFGLEKFSRKKSIRDSFRNKVDLDRYPYAIVGATSQYHRTARALYKGSIKSDDVEGIEIFYTGTGSFAYVSGLMFIPSGQKLGYITCKSRVINFEPSPQILSMAFNELGIIDLSLSQSTNTASWRDDTEFRKRSAAVIRRFLSRTDQPGRQIEVRAEFDAAKMALCCLFSEDIIPSYGVASKAKLLGIRFNKEDEMYIERNTWIPAPPPANLFIDPIHLHRDEHSEWIGFFPPRPIEQILFPDLLINKVTIHMLRQPGEICGLTFAFESLSPHSITIGQTGGAQVDLLIHSESGERISTMMIISDSQYSEEGIRGLAIHTNHKRHILAGNGHYEDGHINALLFENSTTIKGICASRMRRDGVTWFETVGVLTSQKLDLSQIVRIDMKEHRKLRAEASANNAPKSPPEGQDHSNIDPEDGGPYTTNTASLDGCIQIIFHLRTSPVMRISGLRLVYDLGDLGNSQTLGQVEFEDAEKLIVDIQADDRISELTIHMHASDGTRQGNHDHFVEGFEIKTFLGIEHIVGRKPDSKDSGLTEIPGSESRCRLIIESGSIIQWEYNQKWDRIRLQNASEGLHNQKSEDEPSPKP